MKSERTRGPTNVPSGQRRAWFVRSAIRRGGIAARLLGYAAACLLASPLTTRGQSILEAGYDTASDALVVGIAYRGTHPEHRFRLEWEPCRPAPDGRGTVVARLIDLHGDDMARNEFRIVRRFELSALDCRPAEVTIRLGPVSNRTVSVPERDR